MPHSVPWPQGEYLSYACSAAERDMHSPLLLVGYSPVPAVGALTLEGLLPSRES